jgi:hypothetical protein
MLATLRVSGSMGRPKHSVRLSVPITTGLRVQIEPVKYRKGVKTSNSVVCLYSSASQRCTLIAETARKGF